MDRAKTTARQDDKHLYLGIVCLILEIWRYISTKVLIYTPAPMKVNGWYTGFALSICPSAHPSACLTICPSDCRQSLWKKGTGSTVLSFNAHTYITSLLTPIDFCQSLDILSPLRGTACCNRKEVCFMGNKSNAGFIQLFFLCTALKEWQRCLYSGYLCYRNYWIRCTSLLCAYHNLFIFDANHSVIFKAIYCSPLSYFSHSPRQSTQ